MLCASLTLLLLFWQWHPIRTVIWHVEDPDITMAIVTLAFVGWVTVFLSIFQMNHVKVSGAHQPALPIPVFRRLFRHPIYLGLIAACWAAPTMSAGHLLLAAATTAYIFLGIALEGREPAGMFGREYRRCRQRVMERAPGDGRTHHC
jgi:methanethiol S-methyltransferase